MAGKDRNFYQEVRRSYTDSKLNDELRGEWGAILLYRWISFIVTPWFLKASISANTVTLFSLIFALCIPLSLLLDSTYDYIYLTVSGIIICVLDCVDGNIARTTNNITQLGHYSDFIVDVIYRIAIYITLGLIVHKNSMFYNISNIQPLLLACLAALMAISARMSRIYVENKFEIHSFPVQAPHGSGIKMNTIVGRVFSFVSGLDHFLPIFILITGILNKIHWIIVWIFFYSALDFLYTQFSIVRRLK